MRKMRINPPDWLWKCEYCSNPSKTVKQNPEELLAKQISLKYWPKPEMNESADRIKGDTFVEGLTMKELEDFFTTNKCGPTYYVVRRRVEKFIKIVSQSADYKKQSGELLDTLNHFLNGLTQSIKYHRTIDL